MALDATVGGATSNTYATLAEFNAYAATRVPAFSWFTTASDATKEAALQEACRLLDACFDWTGSAVDNVQVLTWPRQGMLTRNNFAIPTTVNPQELKNAQCELALQLGAGDLMSENQALRDGIASIRAGSVGISFQPTYTNSRDAVDMAIMRLTSEFLYVSKAIPQAVRMLLVPSWFNQPTIIRPMLFTALGGSQTRS